jgi:hypothetical protein
MFQNLGQFLIYCHVDDIAEAYSLLVEAYLFLVEQKENKLAETNNPPEKKKLKTDMAHYLIDLGNHIINLTKMRAKCE